MISGYGLSDIVLSRLDVQNLVRSHFLARPACFTVAASSSTRNLAMRAWLPAFPLLQCGRVFIDAESCDGPTPDHPCTGFNVAASSSTRNPDLPKPIRDYLASFNVAASSSTRNPIEMQVIDPHDPASMWPRLHRRGIAFYLPRPASLPKLQCGRVFIDAESPAFVPDVFVEIALQCGRVFIDAESRSIAPTPTMSLRFNVAASSSTRNHASRLQHIHGREASMWPRLHRRGIRAGRHCSALASSRFNVAASSSTRNREFVTDSDARLDGFNVAASSSTRNLDAEKRSVGMIEPLQCGRVFIDAES